MDKEKEKGMSIQYVIFRVCIRKKARRCNDYTKSVILACVCVLSSDKRSRTLKKSRIRSERKKKENWKMMKQQTCTIPSSLAVIVTRALKFTHACTFSLVTVTLSLFVSHTLHPSSYSSSSLSSTSSSSHDHRQEKRCMWREKKRQD